MRGLFITSTGTDIGKTTFLVHLLHHDYLNLRLLTATKPLISGWPHHNEDIQQTDSGRLLTAQNLPLTQSNLDWISPQRFFEPLAPSMIKTNQPLDVKALIETCTAQSQTARLHKKLHLIEGVGGVMSPIAPKWTNVDWLKALKCPCILVIGSYLGTFSHTLSALNVLQSRQIPVWSVILSETKNSTVSFNDTYAHLKTWIPEIPIYRMANSENTGVLDEIAACYHALTLALKAHDNESYIV